MRMCMCMCMCMQRRTDPTTATTDEHHTTTRSPGTNAMVSQRHEHVREDVSGQEGEQQRRQHQDCDPERASHAALLGGGGVRDEAGARGDGGGRPLELGQRDGAHSGRLQRLLQCSERGPRHNARPRGGEDQRPLIVSAQRGEGEARLRINARVCSAEVDAEGARLGDHANGEVKVRKRVQLGRRTSEQRLVGDREDGRELLRPARRGELTHRRSGGCSSERLAVRLHKLVLQPRQIGIELRRHRSGVYAGQRRSGLIERGCLVG
mmetsp:Transcript_42059/g.135220  ORF Transcript_42059/g.135220 Transcript_42059/m.135220 type:complete len:265 (+) Transcript_42059:3-797(+)